MFRRFFQSMSWDSLVFLSVSLFGLALTFQHFQSNPGRAAGRTQVSSVLAESLGNVENNVIDLGCIDGDAKALSFSKDRTRVRFKGKVCHTRKNRMPESSVSIKNISSGSTGLVFMKGNSNQFYTGDIVLRPGKNVIQVEWKDIIAQSERSVTALVNNEPF